MRPTTPDQAALNVAAARRAAAEVEPIGRQIGAELDAAAIEVEYGEVESLLGAAYVAGKQDLDASYVPKLLGLAADQAAETGVASDPGLAAL